MEDARYSLAHRLLHWVLAILVIAALIGGAFLWAYGFDGLKNTFGIGITGLIYKYHKTFGVLILGLMVLRLVLRYGVGIPAPAPSLNGFERMASATVHTLFYVALIAMPVTGWLATAAGGFPVEFFDWKLPGLIGKDPALSETLYEIHGLLGLAIFGLFVLHVGGAIMHWRIKRDGVMRRMSLFG